MEQRRTFRMFCSGETFGRSIGFVQFDGREFRYPAEQGIDAGANFEFVSPLFVQRFLQDVDGFEAEIDDRWRWLDFLVTQTADQVFNAMSNGAEALQANLRGGTF